MSMNGFVERQETIGATVLAAGRRAVRHYAEGLSRRGVAKAHAEHCNEAVRRCLELLYERDTDGKACNVEPTGRILIPVPWGEAGHKKYGLRSTECRALRRFLMDAPARLPRQVPPLLVYAPEARQWFLNWRDADYGTLAGALEYWQRFCMSESNYKELDGLRKDARRNV